MYYFPVQKLQGVLFLCLGAASALFFNSVAAGHAILPVSCCRMFYYSVQELQGVLFFCLGVAVAQFFCSVVTGFVIFLFRSCRVCYSCLECGLEFRRKELGQGIREVGLAHGRIVNQVEGRH